MSKMKYLWGTALVMLCLALASGVAFAQVQWTASDQTLPTGIAWDDTFAANVEATHVTGSGQLDPGTWGLVSVQGVTAAASALDRWGRVTADPTGLVYFMGGASHDIDFTITGPPMTTLSYAAPVGLTDPGTYSTLACNWILASPYTPTPTFLTSDTAVADVAVCRFPDMVSGTPRAQSVFWIDELAGRVPLVVKGFPNGDYGPAVDVDRGVMAIFMARALKLPLVTPTGPFVDVPSDHYAAEYINAINTAGIAFGFDATHYAPDVVVSRDQMAIFVARGMAGGDANVPSGPATPTFVDVPATNAAYKYVEYCYANGVVKGFSPTVYGPTVNVSRDQMAIFVWRGFMMATGVPVVLAGPACTSVMDPATATYLGWTSDHVNPVYAYVALDALRLDVNLCAGGNNAWDVQFEVRTAANPTGAAVASSAVMSLNPGQLGNVWNLARASGDPYLWYSWTLPALAQNDYVLVVLVEDETGTMHEVGWKPVLETEANPGGGFFAFTVTP